MYSSRICNTMPILSMSAVNTRIVPSKFQIWQRHEDTTKYIHNQHSDQSMDAIHCTSMHTFNWVLLLSSSHWWNESTPQEHIGNDGQSEACLQKYGLVWTPVDSPNALTVLSWFDLITFCTASVCVCSCHGLRRVDILWISSCAGY